MEFATSVTIGFRPFRPGRMASLGCDAGGDLAHVSHRGYACWGRGEHAEAENEDRPAGPAARRGARKAGANTSRGEGRAQGRDVRHDPGPRLARAAGEG